MSFSTYFISFSKILHIILFFQIFNMQWLTSYLVVLLVIFMTISSSNSASSPPCRKPTCPTQPKCSKYEILQPVTDINGCPGCPVCCPGSPVYCTDDVKICKPGYIPPPNPCRYHCPDCVPPTDTK